MNEKGSVSTEILVVLIVILLIIGITAKFSEITLDKLATSTENENIELLLSQSADNLINNNRNSKLGKIFSRYTRISYFK